MDLTGRDGNIQHPRDAFPFTKATSDELAELEALVWAAPCWILANQRVLMANDLASPLVAVIGRDNKKRCLLRIHDRVDQARCQLAARWSASAAA